MKFSSARDAVELLARRDRFVQHRSLLVAIRRPAPVVCVPQRETSDTRLIRRRISFCRVSHAQRLISSMVIMGGRNVRKAGQLGKKRGFTTNPTPAPKEAN